MRKLSLAAFALACAFAVAGCTSAQLLTASTDLTALGQALDATAATLPAACNNLNAAIDQVSATPNLPAKIVSTLESGNSKFQNYCTQAIAAATASAAAVTDINTFISSLAKALAATSAS